MKENFSNLELEIEELDPTFLYTWKGTRSPKEERYHSHECMEMAFVVSGKGRYKIDDEFYDVSEGDLLIINPGVKHQALYVESIEVPATEFYIGFTKVAIKDYPKNFIPLPEKGNILHTKGKVRQQISRLCSMMEEEGSAYLQGRYYMLKTYLVQILLTVIREQAKPIEYQGGYEFESTNKKYIVKNILNYFEEHYNEKISLDMIAENMYLSPFYISKLFKTETGEAPIRHLIDIRLEKAKEILEQNKFDSIKDVAAEVGYDDAYYFSKLFKKKYGFSPSQVGK